MTASDLLGLALEALRAHRLRYGLSALAIAVGIASVVLMSAIGEGTRLFIQSQVSAFGTAIVGVHPGRVETAGIPGGMGGGARRLTIDDARAMARLPGVAATVPVVYGSALVEVEGRGRRVLMYGVSAQMPRVWQMDVGTGRFLADVDWARGSSELVLGPRLKRELFGDANALGQAVRVGTRRFRVVGVMESKGEFMGFDLDDTGYLSVADAMALFDSRELGEVNLAAATPADVDGVVDRVRETMIDRHGGREDVTIVTQKEALQMVNAVLDVVTGTVTAIAAISLFVGAIGIFTILWIVVRERTQEIGLVKALGGTRGQILAWYLCEAALTAGVGGVAGLAAGLGGAVLLAGLVPGLQASASEGIVLSALGMAVGVGLAAGTAPAMRAARLDPVEALRAE